MFTYHQNICSNICLPLWKASLNQKRLQLVKQTKKYGIDYQQLDYKLSEMLHYIDFSWRW